MAGGSWPNLECISLILAGVTATTLTTNEIYSEKYNETSAESNCKWSLEPPKIKWTLTKPQIDMLF